MRKRKRFAAWVCVLGLVVGACTEDSGDDGAAGIDDGVVATVHDTTAANPTGVIETTEPAGLPRIGISPGSEELSASNSFPIGGGGVGTTFMMFPTLARTERTEIALIHVDT